MDCQEATLLIHGYVDGELDLRAALEIEKHLASCAMCTKSLANHRALSTILRSGPLHVRAPDALKARLAASLGAATKPAGILPYGWRFLRLAAPVAAFALLVLVVWPRWPRAGEDGGPGEDVISSHVRSLLPGHLEDVVSTDRHTVKPWFAGKLDYAPPVEDFAPEGFPLAGGRLDYLVRRTVAALVYRRRGHIINLYVWPATPGATGMDTVATVSGYHAKRWVQHEFVYWVVSDLNQMELDQFAALVRSR